MPQVICPVIKDYCIAAEQDAFGKTYCQISGERVTKGDTCPYDEEVE